MESPFLSRIAKDYNSGVEAVEFKTLEKDMVGKVVASKLRDAYRIFIDKEKMKCAYQTMFVLYHEIAHIELFHLGYKFYLSCATLKEAREKEADHWALNKLGAIDAAGKPIKNNMACHECLINNSQICLKYKK